MRLQLCVFSCPQVAAVAAAERGLMGRQGAPPGLSLKVTKPGVGGDTASQSQAKLTLAFLFLENSTRR